MEDFDDQISSDDNEIPAELVDQLHFVDRQKKSGGKEGDSSKPKSKKEIYEEIIKKSKLFKREK